MRRWLCFTVFLGALTTLLSVGPAGADDSCDGGFSARLKCWSRGIGDHTVTVTLDEELASGPLPAAVPDERYNLEVQVPAGKTTGAGGTALLVLAGHRLVHRDARITRLSQAQITELERVGACTPKPPRDLCDEVGPGTGTQVSGRALRGKYGIADLPRTTYSLAPSGSSGPGPKDWSLIGMGTLLAVLLVAFVLVLRRSGTPRAALAGPGSPPASAEDTTPLRSSDGRRPAGPGSGPSRPAVVRTDLHPQGYVELDRVLYRALWAEPGQPPPAPGSRVDVTDAAEADAGVLYAFPPAAGRHAHAR